MTRPDVSVIVTNWNGRALLEACLQSIYDKTTDLRTEIIVVDDASTDGSADLVHSTFPSVACPTVDSANARFSCMTPDPQNFSASIMETSMRSPRGYCMPGIIVLNFASALFRGSSPQEN